jgi:predicted phosphodiesterase
MRLAVISDIHGNIIALENVLRDLESAGGADRIWVLGDLAALGSRPAECVARIRELKNCEVIGGNTERYLFGEHKYVTGHWSGQPPKDADEWQMILNKRRDREAAFLWTAEQLDYESAGFLLKTIRRELDLHVPGYGYVVGYHGAPGSDEAVMLPDTPADEVLDQFSDREGRLGFGGHTHVAMDRDLGDWRVVNIGSVGMPYDEPSSSYVIATFEDGQAQIDFRRVDCDWDAVKKDILQRSEAVWEMFYSKVKTVGI